MTDDMAGRILSGFQIMSLLGEGAHGSVWRARQLRLDREVALKILDPVIARNADTVGRFEREGRAAASLDHPNVVPVYEAGESDGLVFLAMRLVEGVTLEDHIGEVGPLDRADAVDLLAPVAAALDHVHQRGMVHRDVKPSNILIEGDRIWLADFGIAASLRELGSYTSGALGTAEYMAPEQANAADVDRRADIYGLGCVAHFIMEGRPPHERDDIIATLMAHARDPIPEVGDSRRDRFYHRALAKDPDDRFQSGAELVAALAASPGPARTTSTRDARPRFKWLLAAGVVTALVAVVVAAMFAQDSGDISDLSAPPPTNQPTIKPAEGEPSPEDETGQASSGTTIVVGGSTTLAAGGSIEVGTIRGLKNLNPHVDLDIEPFLTGNVLPPLMVVAEDWSLQPWLAASEPEVLSADPLTVRWHLREDAKWDDGSPVSSYDVSRTLDYIMSPDSGAVAAALYSGVTIDVINEKTLDMVFETPNGSYLILFSTIHPVIKAAAYDEHLAAGNSPATFLVGDVGFSSGPFRVAGFDNGERLTLVRNDHWWGEPALLDRITIRNFDTARKQLKAIESGDVDLAYVETASTSDVVTARSFEGVMLDVGAAARWVRLDMNTRIGPTSELAVREAIVRTLDRNVIAAGVVTPVTGELSSPLQSLIWPATHPSNGEPFAQYRGDVTAAQELLQTAGWELGPQGARIKDGQVLEIEMLYDSASGVLGQTLAQSVVVQLRDAGIRVVARVREPSDLAGRVVSGDYALAVFTDISSPDPVPAIIRWDSSYCPIQFGLSGCDSDIAGNTTGVSDTELDNLLEMAQAEVDPVARALAFDRVDARLAEILPSVPLFEMPGFVVYSKVLGGVQLETQRSGPFSGMYGWGFLAS